MSEKLISLENLQKYNELLDGKISSKQDSLVLREGIENFPTAGESGKIYVDTTNEKIYRWDSTEYIELNPSSVDIATTESAGIVKPDGDTISVSDDGAIKVNTEIIATQEDVEAVNDNIKDVDAWIPNFVEYEEDELYELAWNSVTMTERPEYTTDDLDNILDSIDFTGIKFSVPMATTTTIGGVKPDGTTIIIDENGVISSIGGSGGNSEIAIGNDEPTDENITLWIDTDENYESTYLTEESDPTVPDWAKNSTKPTYTASEVGALDEDNEISSSEIELLFNGIFNIV